jgi:hypothetical protein
MDPVSIQAERFMLSYQQIKQWTSGYDDRRFLYQLICSDAFTHLTATLSSQVTRPLRFFITWERGQGMGDMLHAIKTSLILKENFSHAVIQILIPANTILPKLFEEHGLQNCIFTTSNISSLPNIFNEHQYLFEVATPVPDGQRADIEMLKQKFPNIKHIQFDEYNGCRFLDDDNISKDVFVFTLGIDSVIKEDLLMSCVGIHIDTPPTPSPLMRNRIISLQKLQKPALYSLILGKYTISRFASSNKLFFGYFSQDDTLFYLYRFFFTILHSETKNTNDLTFVIVNGSHFTADFIVECFNLERIKLLKTKCLLGSQLFTATCANKEIRLIFTSRLPHQDVLSLMDTSERPTLVSGDQSLAEAISRNKIIFYQKQSWKQSLAEQICVVASNTDYVASSFFKFSFLNDETKLDLTIAKRLSHRTFLSGITKVNQTICRLFNIKTFIVGLVTTFELDIAEPRFINYRDFLISAKKTTEKAAITKCLKRVFEKDIQPRKRNKNNIEAELSAALH